jgi:hypothetical protein
MSKAASQGLAEAGGEQDEGPLSSLLARLREREERLLLELHAHSWIVYAATVDGCRTTRPGMFWKSSVLNVTSSVTPEESITAAIRASWARLP